MRLKWLFTIVSLLVFGALIGLGFYFYEKEPLYFWVIEGVAALAIGLFVWLYYRLVRPYRLLSDSIDLLKAQDFSSRLREVRNREANRLIEVFNRMITQLKNERLSVREKNRFLDLLLEASPQGVIVLDFDGYLTEINPAGLAMLRVKRAEEVMGKKPEEIPSELGAGLAGLESGGEEIIRTSDQLVYRCSRSSFVDSGFDRSFFLIEELTDEIHRVEKTSYERIIRMMSHEVNNSVGAISSTLNVVSDILQNENNGEWNDVLPALDASFDRCGKLSQFVGNLADVIRIPEPSIAWLSLNELVRSVDALIRMECRRRGIELILSLNENEPRILADGIQMEQVLVNLAKNAYEAIGSGGTIRISTSASPAGVTLEDDGPGIPIGIQKKLFTPFFTTKPTGNGIGLMFVREVLNNHGFRFSFSSVPGRTVFLFSTEK